MTLRDALFEKNSAHPQKQSSRSRRVRFGFATLHNSRSCPTMSSAASSTTGTLYSIRNDQVSKQRRKSSFKKESSPSRSASCSASTWSTPSKCLHFGVVDVYEFDVIVGDNPFVKSGCPIAVGTMQSHSVVNLEYYETYCKSPHKKTRDELRVGVLDRAQRLLRAGFSLTEIAEGTLEAERVKRERAETNRNIKWDGVHHVTETLKRTFLLRPTRSTRHLIVSTATTLSSALAAKTTATTLTFTPSIEQTPRVARSA
jgi:hypothetical protein